MTFIGEHKKDILQLIMLMLIGLILYKMVFLVAYKSYIVANWPEYMCNPAFIPLVGMLNIPDPDPNSESGFMTVKKNATNCLKQRMGSEMNKHLQEPMNMVGRLADGQKGHSKAISNTHSFMSSIQGDMTSVTGDMTGKLQAGQSLMKFYAIQFKELFKKLFAIFMTMIYIMKTTESTLKGLFMGPLAQGIHEFMCSWLHVFVCTYIDCMCVLVHVRTRVRVCASACMSVCICVCACVCMCACLHVCIQARMYA